MGLFGKKKKAPLAGADAKPENGAAVPEDAGAVGAAGIGDELVAAIAAAISAYEAEQYRQALYIRKPDRAAGVRPAWGVAGMHEAIDMRRM